MKKRLLALAALMILLPLTPAMAGNWKHGRDRHYGDWYQRENQDSRGYVSVKLGVFMPDEHADILDNGYAIGAAIGGRLNPNFALEIGLENVSTEFDEDYTYDRVDVNTLGVPVTAKVVLPLSNQVELYAGAGFGLYFTTIDDYDYPDGYYHDDGVDETSLGFHSLIGADFKVNPAMAFTMELKYTEIQEDFDDYFFDDLELGGTTASLGIRFLF